MENSQDRIGITLGIKSSDSDIQSQALRIVHAANLQMNKDGACLYNQDQKIHHGLIRLGHFVYIFPINDRARMLSPFGGKDLGKGRANRALIKTCYNVHPDVLLLGHSQYISAVTLREIRQMLPKIRIGLWYVDPLWDEAKIRHLRQRIELLDAVCCSTAGPLLASLATDSCAAGFIPSAVDPGIEYLRAFETPENEIVHDAIFFGTDKRLPERRQFLLELKDSVSDLRLGIYGCLGNPGIHGWQKEQVIRCAKMGLNLTRRFDVTLYSSMRVAELIGNGILTLIPRGAGLQELYAEDEVVYFDDVQDLADKIRKFSADKEHRIAIARKGWQRMHQDYSSTKIAEFILALTLRDKSWKQASWARHVFIKD